MRHCGNCGQAGHYKSTCKSEENVLLPKERNSEGTILPIYVGQLKDATQPSVFKLSDKPVGYAEFAKKFDAQKYPYLAAATDRGNALVQKNKDDWKRVIELKAAGKEGSADRLVRKIFGIQEPMTEEDKEKLRIYNADHAEEIKQRKEERKALKARTLELIQNTSKKLNKKRGK